MKTLIDTVQDITGGEVDFSELDNVLQKMGIDPSPKEHLELNKSLPVNASRNVYKNRLLTCPEDIIGLQVDDHDLDSILENMAIRLTAEELNDLTPTLPVDANGKFGVSILTDGMDGVKAIRGKVDVNDLKKVPGNTGRELKDKKHGELVNNLPINGEIIDVNKADAPLQNMGMSLSEKEINDLKQDLPVDAAGNVFQSRMLDNVKSFKGGKVKVNNLDTVLENLGIKLTQKELEGVTENLPLT
ncbi:hypothetical protein GH733_016545, partial [Mirounga leonina]